MKRPYISIITCTRNSERYIERNLISVKNQTFGDYEQVIIDGESTDKTRMLIANAIKNGQSKLTCFIRKAKGISNAFNKGILKAKGEYIYFLNSDDYLHDDNVLNDVATNLKDNSEFDWIYGKIEVIEDNGSVIGTFPNQKIFQLSNKHLLKLINYIPHQAVFMKKNIFDSFGVFDESLSSEMDYDYWLRIAESTRWKFINRIIADYTIGKTAQSSSAKNAEANNRNLDKVQKKYLNMPEYFITRIINYYIRNFNKITR